MFVSVGVWESVGAEINWFPEPNIIILSLIIGSLSPSYSLTHALSPPPSRHPDGSIRSARDSIAIFSVG